MKARYIITVTAILLALCSAEVASAQKMPERRLVRKGNRQYERGEIEKSIENYNRALAIDPTSFEAAYDLGSALFRAERYDKAVKQAVRIPGRVPGGFGQVRQRNILRQIAFNIVLHSLHSFDAFIHPSFTTLQPNHKISGRNFLDFIC